MRLSCQVQNFVRVKFFLETILNSVGLLYPLQTTFGMDTTTDSFPSLLENTTEFELALTTAVDTGIEYDIHQKHLNRYFEGVLWETQTGRLLCYISI